MAYIGKSPSGTGVRSRFFYTQSTAGATSISGNDDDNRTLTFSDAEYVDVYLNGSLLAKGDYTAASNTISGLAALASGDIVEVVVYDIFSVADTVSAKDGGTFSGNVGMQGLTATTGTFSGGLTLSQTASVSSDIEGDRTDSQITLKGGSTGAGIQLFGDTYTNYAGAMYLDATASTTGTNDAQMVFRTGSTPSEAMRIDRNGVVTAPKTPAFHVRLDDNGAVVQTPHTTHTVWENQGGHWNSSSSRFVAPVAGFYWFMVSGYTNFSSGHGYIGIRKNGTQVHNGWHWNLNNVTQHVMGNMTAGLTLQANDYVDFTRPSAGAGSRFDILNASGFLIG